MASPHRRTNGVASAAALFIGAFVSVFVGAWALATPDKDPLGDSGALSHGVLVRAIAWVRAEIADPPPDWKAASMQVPQGNADTGARLMVEYGCGGCHVIPGVARARGTVGPSLAGLRDRAYLAGVLPNRPDDLVGWLMHPTVHAPQTVMPDLGVTEAQARHMAAHLYTLRGRQ